MLKELQELELLSLNLSSYFMLTVGAIMLAVGLFTWLGGMQWRVFTGLIVGALAGCVCVLFIGDQYFVHGFVISAAVGFSFVMLFKKRGMVLVGALLAAVVCAIVMPGKPVKAIDSEENSVSEVQVVPNYRKTAGASFVVLKSEFIDLGKILVNDLKNTETVALITSSVVAFVIAAVGFLLHRIVSAVATSAVGTLFIYGGMVMMLLQKGAAPITIIYQKSVFYQSIAVFMVIFGAIIGIMLCNADKKSSREETKGEKDG